MSRRDLACRCAQRLHSAGQVAAPGVAELCPEGAGIVARRVVRVAGLAPAESPDRGEPRTRGRLALHGGEVGRLSTAARAASGPATSARTRSASCSTTRSRAADSSSSARCVARWASKRAAICSHRSAACSARRASWSRRASSSVTSRTGAVTDKAAHRFDGLPGGVVETAVSKVAFHRINELRPRVCRVLGDDVEPVGVAASGHADVDPAALVASVSIVWELPTVTPWTPYAVAA